MLLMILHAPYDSTEELVIGDGFTLPIQHTGSFSISTPTTVFNFSNVLHVLFISRNILSISQFCRENNTSIEFLPSLFRVKELLQGKILLQGQLRVMSMNGFLRLHMFLHLLSFLSTLGIIV